MHFICVVFFFKQKTAYEMRISDWSQTWLFRSTTRITTTQQHRTTHCISHVHTATTHIHHTTANSTTSTAHVHNTSTPTAQRVTTGHIHSPTESGGGGGASTNHQLTPCTTTTRPHNPHTIPTHPRSTTTQRQTTHPPPPPHTHTTP